MSETCGCPRPSAVAARGFSSVVFSTIFPVSIYAIVASIVLLCVSVSAQVTDFKLDAAKTSVKFTLDALLHKVDGTFQLGPSVLQLDLATGQVSGEILVNAKSGATGNTMRDRKMQKDVLESDSYPEIQFRPDHVNGTVARSGKSSVMVHGAFRIHGTAREISVPAVVEMTGDAWTATIHFTVPYVKWGMKNPSNLFLHVADSVEIDLDAVGKLEQHNASARDSAR